MLPASSKKGGQCFAFPDVCKTPAAPSPLPLPYPNFGFLNQTDKVIEIVLMENKETVVETSQIPSSKGDEAGTLKGVVSNTNMDKVQFKRYSSKVFAKGKKIVFHTAITAQNGSSANMPAGCHVAPSQMKVFVAM